MNPALKSYALSFFADRDTRPVSEWCCENLRFKEPGNNGPFSLAGREYIREPLDTFGHDSYSDVVLAFGSQSGKTVIFMGGMAWTLINRPSWFLMVMPTQSVVLHKFSADRWIPMLKNSPVFAKHIESAGRYGIANKRQVVGPSIVEMAWSNSISELSSTPCRIVIQDEVDKFKDALGAEASGADLADQRTKRFPNPKRYKSSTPSITEGLIWKELQKTDIRRRFVPCPGCGQKVVFAWSKQYTVFPIKGTEAFIHWDQTAKREDGTWDYDAVEKTAHAKCPHCERKIKDWEKGGMDKKGEWQATQETSRGTRGYHLPSLYAIGAETTFGKLAVKFLKATASLSGLQSFINGDLAEPYVGQELSTKRTESISLKIEAGAEWLSIMTVDCQQKSPHFWYAIRQWKRDGSKSVGLESGSVDHWDELDRIKRDHGVDDFSFMVDSGFGAKSEAEVYRNCAEHSVLEKRQDALPVLVGWMPAKGMPGGKKWRDVKTNAFLPYYLRPIDPFMGTADAGKCVIELFEFSADYFKDILANMRKKDSKHKWSVAANAATDEYWRHMDGQRKLPVIGKFGRVTHQWQKRNKNWPDHIFACEVEQVAFANFLGILSLE